ncbi:MAG: 4Fe-4S double cluster binding domain-containing protein [Acidimicrobiia bacterium]
MTPSTSEGLTGVRDGTNCKEPPYSWVIDTPVATTTQLRDLAASHGASTFGVTVAEPFAGALATLREHKATGLSGALRFTYDDPDVATDIRTSFPWAQSLIVVGVNYATRASGPASTGALVARFATADHYEPVRLVTGRIADQLKMLDGRAEVLIDDNRLVDRTAAARSGVGWIGKSTMLLAPGHGPWTLIGSVVTDIKLEPTSPTSRGCGTCVACIPACPTDAITPDGIDARRCLSAWLQAAGSLPHWIRPTLGRRIYGCDDCLTSCPPGGKVLDNVGNKPLWLPFTELLEMKDEQLLDRFSWWYVPRRDGRFIRRNLLVAAGNSRESSVLETIERHLSHRSSMIRSHAAWALARATGKGARQRLIEILDQERAPETRIEMALALVMIDHPKDYEALLALDELSATTTIAL